MESKLNSEVKFAKNVLLIDVAILNREAASMRRAMSWGLKRELSLIDMPNWLTCVALDGGVLEYDSEVQVILVHESPETKLTVAQQPDFVGADGMAFFVPQVGEFTISCVHPSGFTDTCGLFFDLMHILIDSADVENLMLVPSEELYGNSVKEELAHIIQEKGAKTVEKVCLFNLLPAEKQEPYRQDIITLSLGHAMGIKPEDVGR